MKLLKKNKKGNVTNFVFFIIFAIVLTLIAAAFIPISVNFLTQSFSAGDNILNLSYNVVQNVSNSAMQQQINSSLYDAQQATADNVSILSYAYKYSWVFILLTLFLIVFLATRRQVESGSFG